MLFTCYVFFSLSSVDKNFARSNGIDNSDSYFIAGSRSFPLNTSVAYFFTARSVLCRACDLIFLFFVKEIEPVELFRAPRPRLIVKLVYSSKSALLFKTRFFESFSLGDVGGESCFTCLLELTLV